MNKQQSTGQMQQKPHSCRPAEHLPALGSSSRDGSGASLPMEDGNKPVPAAGLGTEGQQGRECQPGRGTGSLQGMQQTPDPEACPHQGTQTLLLSIVPRNVAEMFQWG